MPLEGGISSAADSDALSALESAAVGFVSLKYGLIVKTSGQIAIGEWAAYEALQPVFEPRVGEGGVA